MVKFLFGRRIAKIILRDLQKKIERSKVHPRLAVILVGKNPSSRIYVGIKEQRAREIGMAFERYSFPSHVRSQELLACIHALNDRPDIHGIVVQLPLPRHLDVGVVMKAIDPAKDADGFHSSNLKLFYDNEPRIIPGVLEGILMLVKSTRRSLCRRDVHLLGNNPVFTQPLKKLFEDEGAVVSVGRDLRFLPKTDILVVALGKPHRILPHHIKKGAMVVDVGFSRRDGKVMGDVHPSVKRKAGWLTPVPGGVGPMTVAMLLKNVVQLAMADRRERP